MGAAPAWSGLTVREAFDSIDANGDGSITIDELLEKWSDLRHLRSRPVKPAYVDIYVSQDRSKAVVDVLGGGVGGEPPLAVDVEVIPVGGEGKGDSAASRCRVRGVCDAQNIGALTRVVGKATGGAGGANIVTQPLGIVSFAFLHEVSVRLARSRSREDRKDTEATRRAIQKYIKRFDADGNGTLELPEFFACVRLWQTTNGGLVPEASGFLFNVFGASLWAACAATAGAIGMRRGSSQIVAYTGTPELAFPAYSFGCVAFLATAQAFDFGTYRPVLASNARSLRAVPSFQRWALFSGVAVSTGFLLSPIVTPCLFTLGPIAGEAIYKSIMVSGLSFAAARAAVSDETANRGLKLSRRVLVWTAGAAIGTALSLVEFAALRARVAGLIGMSPGENPTAGASGQARPRLAIGAALCAVGAISAHVAEKALTQYQSGNPDHHVPPVFDLIWFCDVMLSVTQAIVRSVARS